MLHSNNRPAPSQNEQKSYYSNLSVSFSHGLVPVFENENGDLCCDARSLHRKLKSKTRFNDWIERKLLTDDYQEGESYYSKLSIRSDGKSGRQRTDYILTVETAKELAMMEQNQEGKKVRRYFIQLEKAFKAMVRALFTPINGIMPIHQNGQVGIPRKEFLISIDRSHKNGYRLRHKFPKECFSIGRTACISIDLANVLYGKYNVRQLELDLFNTQNQIAQ